MDEGLTPFGRRAKQFAEKRGLTLEEVLKKTSDLMRRDGLSEPEIERRLEDFATHLYRDAQQKRAVTPDPDDRFYCSEN